MRIDEFAGPARRRDDVGNPAAMLHTLRFLMTRPTCEQICQQLTLDLLQDHGPRQAVLALFGADGSLHVVGDFGATSRDAVAGTRLSLWDHQPLADAVRTGEPVTIDVAAGESTPMVGGADAFPLVVAWPLNLPSQRVGALQIACAGPTDLDRLRADLTGISAALALYLSLLTSIAASPDQALSVLSASDSHGPLALGDFSAVQGRANGRPAPQSLTERQTSVLELMAQGMTNAQIAKRIGFSESTVRQETMVIYRFFGVGGRQEAVAQASQRGLLQTD